MTPHPLDNPVWSSLMTCHAGFALQSGSVARYPAEVAPFVGVDAANVDASEQAERIVQTGELVCFVGPVPALSTRWRIEQSVRIAQMLCRSRLEIVDGPDVVAMTDAHLPDMLALTALVYPHYFRARTPAMGRYIGIYDGPRLAAMAGERMHFDGHCEISAVCTHPDYLGRGYARRMIAMLTNGILDRGELPFLHFSHDNERAKALYERMGFVYRTDVPLLVATRVA
jgi:ribosomal protein S18 acetylase RimI-like enzyme